MVAACGRNNNNNNGVLGMTHYSARHWYYKNASDGVVLWHVCQLQKQLLALTCLPEHLCPSIWNNLAPIGKIFMKFYIETSIKIGQEN
jgi:hypothetical protein